MTKSKTTPVTQLNPSNERREMKQRIIETSAT